MNEHKFLVKDLAANFICGFNTEKEISKYTRVPLDIIKVYCTEKINQPINGFLIKERSSNKAWCNLRNINFTNTHVTKRVRTKLSGGVDRKKCLAKNLVSGQVTKFDSISDCASWFGINEHSLRSLIYKQANYPVRNFIFKYATPDVQWPEFSKGDLDKFAFLERMKHRKCLNTRIFRIKYPNNPKHETVVGVKALASAISITSTTIPTKPVNEVINGVRVDELDFDY